jgi:hypothetical protein
MASECFDYFANIDPDLAVRLSMSGMVLRGCHLEYRIVCKLMLLTTYPPTHRGESSAFFFLP